jgi:3-hydroxyisobutyrate dehydrogenase-like beta-hydroxyacid dehydrogenase
MKWEKERSMRVAVLGIGLMGAAIARRLDEVGGFDLVLWNRTRAKAEDLGIGRVASTPAEAGVGADLVITSVLDPGALRSVFQGPDGLLRVADHQVFLETSTCGPDVLIELSEALAASGSRLIDSPLLGSTGAVLDGALDIILGAEEGAVAAAQPVLDALGKARIVGPVGQAARLKLVHNTMLAVVSAMTAEMLVAAEACGLDRKEAFTMISRISPYMKRREAGFLHEEFDSVTFAMTGVVKDLDLAIGMFHDVGSTLPLTALAREIYSEATRENGHLDMSAIVRRYEG